MSIYALISSIVKGNHAVASGSAGWETWRLWATSFDSSKLSLRIFHNIWDECS